MPKLQFDPCPHCSGRGWVRDEGKWRQCRPCAVTGAQGIPVEGRPDEIVLPKVRKSRPVMFEVVR